MQGKCIKEIFNDYNVDDNNLIYAKVENINLYKKLNKLQVQVVSSKPITIQDIQSFESYLIKTFVVEKVSIDIKYSDLEIDQNIQDNWDNILAYIAKKEPFSKAMLTNSWITIEDDKVLVNLAMKGAAFLIAKKFDKGLEHLLANLYNKNYVVEFVENVSKDYEKMLLEKQKQEEKEALLELEKQAKIEIEQAKERKKIEQEQEKERKRLEDEKLKEELRQQNPELAAKIEAHQNKDPEVNDEASPLILGRSLMIRTELVKIENIPMTEDAEMKVCVDGEVL